MSKANELVRIRLLRLDAELRRQRQEQIDQVIYMLAAAIVILPVLMLSRSRRLQLAEIAVPNSRIAEVLRRIGRLQPPPDGHRLRTTKAAKWVPFTPAPSLTALASRSEPPSAAG